VEVDLGFLLGDKKKRLNSRKSILRLDNTERRATIALGEMYPD